MTIPMAASASVHAWGRTLDEDARKSAAPGVAGIRDNDDKFGPDFDRAAKGAGVRVLRTAPRAPLMNSFCERFLG
ncbi:MAG: hypothetical protein ACLP1X_08945, partial [Polyangiaceae bacterium]